MAVEPIPFGGQIENGIWDFNKAAGKRIAADAGSKIYKMLSIGTEPFFRREMGERHFTAASAANGIILWSITGFASCFTGTLASPILSALGLYALGRFFHGPLVPILVGLGVIAAYWHFAKENAKRVAEFRAQGKTYHSKSRGLPRWNDPAQALGIRIGGSVVLLLLAPVTGVAFVASMYVSASLAAQQQAALYDRYLDMLDAQIEGELLQDALLGKCPPEVTFLYKPLPETLKPELREDIAAAAVGKPVKIVAQGPRAASKPTAFAPAMQEA